MKTTKHNLRENQTAPVINPKNANGASHPPKNSTVIRDDIANRYTYSASIKKAQRKPEYSIWYPATSSFSASVKSNGVRFNSAIEAMKKMINATGCSKINQPCCCCKTISFKFKLPVIRMIPSTDITSGIS